MIVSRYRANYVVDAGKEEPTAHEVLVPGQMLELQSQAPLTFM